MGFFNDLGKKTTETTSKIAREAKLSMKVTDNKGKIKELYEKLGQEVYENHLKGDETSIKEIISEKCSEIDTLSKEIEDAKKELLVLNNKKLCKKCYAEIEKDAKFCPKCGEKQDEEKTVLEKAEEKLEKEEIAPEKAEEAETVKEELEQKNNEE